MQEFDDDADGLARDVEASGTEAAPTAVESKPPTDELQEMEDVDVPGSYDFIISTTYRSKSRCLHAAAGCYRAKALNFANLSTFSAPLDPSTYDDVCRLCWKQAGPSFQHSLTESDDEDSSSSSSVSSGDGSSALRAP